MTIRPSDLEAYLDEALPAAEMARVEQALRADQDLNRRLAAIHARRNAGVHSLGEIWRGEQLTCPSRDVLGSYLLGALDLALSEYVAFHLDEIGCRWCLANLGDLRNRLAEAPRTAEARRRRYFESSVGRLRRD